MEGSFRIIFWSGSAEHFGQGPATRSRCTCTPFSPNFNSIYTSHFASHKHCGCTITHIIILHWGPTQWIETIQCESTLRIRCGMLQLWIAPRAILQTVDCQTRPMTERTACAGGERERTGLACLRNARTEGRTVPSAKRAQQGQAGCPEHGRRENFSLGQHAVENNVRGQLHRREQNQATEEGCQADPVSRSKSAQKRQHKRIERDYSAYCIMHTSQKQSLRGASSGLPDNVLHSLVICEQI